MEDTRQGILALLQRQDASIGQLTKALLMAPATVRRHLDILQRDQLVAYRVIRQKRGRPEHLYYLTEAGQELMPKRYDYLLGLLIKEAVPSVQEHAPHDLGVYGMNGWDGAGPDVFSRIAEKLVAEHGLASPADPLALLQDVLEAQQFAPTIERNGGQVVVNLWNCPFRRVALENSVVCALDRAIISRLAGTPAFNTMRLDRGDRACAYLVSSYPDAVPLSSKPGAEAQSARAPGDLHLTFPPERG